MLRGGKVNITIKCSVPPPHTLLSNTESQNLFNDQQNKDSRFFGENLIFIDDYISPQFAGVEVGAAGQGGAGLGCQLLGNGCH